MISTPLSVCTSDYYSGSDIDYDDEFVKAAPQYFLSLNESNLILQTLFQYQHSSSSNVSPMKIQQSLKLIKLAKANNLSNEIVIRANAILQQYLSSTCSTDEINESIFIACLSLATKLNGHSTHLNSPHFFNSDSLMVTETLLCNKLDWNIDLITPINFIEAILLHVSNSSVRDRLRQLTYDLVVLCLTDIHCTNLSASSLGIACLWMTCERMNSFDLIPKQVFQYEQEKNILFKTSQIYTQQTVLNTIRG